LLKILIWVAVFSGVWTAAGPMDQWRDDPDDYRNLGSIIAISTESDRFPLRAILSQKPAPLIVDLHQWNSGEKTSFGNDFRLDTAVNVRGWNYVRPFLGSNRTPDGCCSVQQLDRVAEAISYAKKNGAVDVDEVFIVGASGGGYIGLCAMMQGDLDVAAYDLWVPISDIAVWHDQTRGTRYASDVRSCTGSSDILDLAEARRRSPLFMPVPDTLPKVTIRAGINDGWFGAVPITHSIRMFNKLASALGFGEAVVDDAAILRLLETRGEVGFLSNAGQYQIHLSSQAGPVRLELFEGGHEGFSSEVLNDIVDFLGTQPEPEG
jgi:hypothetical protein